MAIKDLIGPGFVGTSTVRFIVARGLGAVAVPPPSPSVGGHPATSVGVVDLEFEKISTRSDGLKELSVSRPQFLRVTTGGVELK